MLQTLESDLEAARHAANLTKQEAAAVSHLLDEALRKERRPDLFRNALFTLVGIGIGAIIEGRLSWPF